MNLFFIEKYIIRSIIAVTNQINTTIIPPVLKRWIIKNDWCTSLIEEAARWWQNETKQKRERIQKNIPAIIGNY